MSTGLADLCPMPQHDDFGNFRHPCKCISAHGHRKRDANSQKLWIQTDVIPDRLRSAHEARQLLRRTEIAAKMRTFVMTHTSVSARTAKEFAPNRQRPIWIADPGTRGNTRLRSDQRSSLPDLGSFRVVRPASLCLSFPEDPAMRSISARAVLLPPLSRIGSLSTYLPVAGSKSLNPL